MRNVIEYNHNEGSHYWISSGRVIRLNYSWTDWKNLRKLEVNEIDLKIKELLYPLLKQMSFPVTANYFLQKAICILSRALFKFFHIYIQLHA